MTDTFDRPGRALITWGLLLAVGYVMLTGFNVRLHAQVEEVRQNSPWTFVKKAEALRAKNDHKGALSMLQQAAALDPSNPEVFEQIGLLHYEADQYAEALQAYRQAVAAGSGKPDTRGKILWCLIHSGRLLEAAQFGEQCMQQGVATSAFPRDTGDAYRRLALRQGRPEDARAALEKARPHLEEGLRRTPRDLRLMDWLVMLYERLGEPGKAEAMLKRLRETEGA